MKDSKYIYLRMKQDGIWYIIELTGKKSDFHRNEGEQWEYVDVLATNSPYYTVSEDASSPTLDMNMFDKRMYPDVEVRYLTYDEVVAYAI